MVETPRGDRSRRTAIGGLSLDDDGILEVSFWDDAEIDVTNMNELLSEQVELLKEHEGLVGLLADATPIRSMTRAAMQQTVSHPANSKTAAVAIVVNSPISRVLGNFYIRLTKHPYPARLFREDQEARGWLRAQLEKRGA